MNQYPDKEPSPDSFVDQRETQSTSFIPHIRKAFNMLVLFSMSQMVSAQMIHLNRDSLKKDLMYTEDTNKIHTFKKLIDEYKTTDLDSFQIYAQELLEYSQEIGNKRGQADGYRYLGIYLKDKIKYEKAIEYHKKAYEIYREIKDINGIATVLNEIGRVFSSKGEFEKTIEYYQKSIDVCENNPHDKEAQQTSMYPLRNLGRVYERLKSYKKAEEYYARAAQVIDKYGDERDKGEMFISLGNFFRAQEENKKAERYYSMALKIYQEINDHNNLADLYNNMGVMFFTNKEWDKALAYIQKAIDTRGKDGSQINLCQNINNMGCVYAAKGEFDTAIEWHNKSLTFAKEINAKTEEKESYSDLSIAYEGKGDFKNALKYKNLFIHLKDSLDEVNNRQYLDELGVKYETEKKENALTVQNLELKEKEAQLSKEEANKRSLWGGIAALITLVSLSVYAFIRSQIQKRRVTLAKEKAEVMKRQAETAKEQAEVVSKELAQKNTEIAQKNTEIMDSINYAKRIQTAILPHDEVVAEMLPNSFILYKPKDIVSGDFYWAYNTPDNKAIWAAADCTGHGVPGAFMSMIGNSLLNQIVIKDNVHDSNKILDALRLGVINALKQTGEGQKDGMDIALCVWDKNTNILQFSGANNSLYLVKNNEIEEIRPDKQPIGYYTDELKPFTKKEIQLERGDRLYTFSDGYTDQFGGPKEKKFKIKNLRDLFLKMKDEPLSKHRDILKKEIEDWMGNHEQTDDIVVIGVEV